MIGVMGLLIANRAIFLHVHKLNDGTIIEHAHPYDKSNDSKPYKSHHHSNAEFLFFQNLDVLFLIAFLTLALITPIKKGEVSFKLISEHTLICIILHKGRAPPIS
jgi:hypothetical protein